MNPDTEARLDRLRTKAVKAQLDYLVANEAVGVIAIHDIPIKQMIREQEALYLEAQIQQSLSRENAFYHQRNFG